MRTSDENDLNRLTTNFTEEISKEMEGLRQGLVALAFCYIDGKFEALDENTHFENFSEKE